MIIYAVDPGSKKSAIVRFDIAERRVIEKYKIDNFAMLGLLRSRKADAQHLAIEMAESFGAKVWGQVFTTVLWTGRFIEAWQGEHTLVTRREVKMTIANSGRAKDPQIRNALIEMWGGKDRAIGTKADPGPLFGLTADCWAALAIGETWRQNSFAKMRAA